MTDVLDAAADTATPRTTVEVWLTNFDDALSRGDARAAAALFVEDSYWRDLIAFTWNITTAEGRDAIAEMLAATLPGVRPSNWSRHRRGGADRRRRHHARRGSSSRPRTAAARASCGCAVTVLMPLRGRC